MTLRNDPDAVRCSANGCESRDCGHSVWPRCQGAVPDLCTNLLCPSHQQACSLCSLPVCENHSQMIDGERVCDACVSDPEGWVLDYLAQSNQPTRDEVN